MLLAALLDLNQSITFRNKSKCLVEVVGENPLEHSFGSVPAPKPDDCGRRSKATDQVNEILVFGQIDRASLSGSVEDLLIISVSKPKVSERSSVMPEAFLNPLGDAWGEMSIEPNHAAITGWSMPLLA